MAFSSGDDVVLSLLCLQYEPHCSDIVLCVAPVAPSVEVAEIELLLQTQFDSRCGAGDFAGNEGLATAFALMVEENAITGKKSIRLTIVHGDVIGVSLCAAVRRTRIERSLFGLRRLASFAEELRGRRLIEPGTNTSFANCFQQAHSPQARHFSGVFGHIKTDSHMRLGAEIVDLVRGSQAENGIERARVV